MLLKISRTSGNRITNHFLPSKFVLFTIPKGSFTFFFSMIKAINNNCSNNDSNNSHSNLIKPMLMVTLFLYYGILALGCPCLFQMYVCTFLQKFAYYQCLCY